MGDFIGKNILITGGSSGIGEAAARYLSSLGAAVILVARNEEKLSKVVNSLSNPGYYYVYDLEDGYHIENIFTFCREKGLKLDGLVHSAGFCSMAPVRMNRMDVAKKVMDVNCLAFLELGKYFSSQKYSNSHGGMVGISSIEAALCDKGQSTYAASKAALEAFVKVMAKEFAGRGLRVNAIAPAIIDTPMLKNSQEAGRYSYEEIKEIQAFGVIDPIQIAYLIEFLLSDKASYITGACIPVSGAWMGEK